MKEDVVKRISESALTTRIEERYQKRLLRLEARDNHTNVLVCPACGHNFLSAEGKSNDTSTSN